MEALWQLICLCRCLAVTGNQIIFNKRAKRILTEVEIERWKKHVCEHEGFRSLQGNEFEIRNTIDVIPILEGNILKVAKCILNKYWTYTEIFTFSSKNKLLITQRDSRGSTRSKVPNWQPDVLFRNEMELLYKKKVFLCDLSNFQLCRHQPVKKCSAIFASVRSGTITLQLSGNLHCFFLQVSFFSAFLSVLFQFRI